MVNGDTALLDAEGVVLDPDPGVSIHVVGTGAPQTALPGLAVTRDLRTDYTDLRYQRALSPTMRKRITELGRPASALDGQLQVPIRLDFADATHWQLGSWPSGTFATATPTSVAADLVQWGTPPASSFVASLFHVVPGDYIQAGLSNITTCLPAIAIFTDSGWVLVRQSQTSGLDTLVITEKVGASPSVETSTINPVVAQTNYRMAKSSVGIIIYDQRSFGLVLNGVVIRRYRTTGNIQRAGWAGGFGTAGNFYVGNPVLYKGKRTFGIKPLKVLSIGDSTGDENVTGQSQFDFARQFIGGVGGCQIETLTNLAHSGDTSAAQLSALQAVTLTGAGYDYCLIQIGINDIQTSVAVATFVDNVMDMVDYCRADGVEPIVGIPAMFYSQTDAQAYGQDGGPTSNSAAGAGYRLALMEALADARVYCNLASFEDMGAVVASLLAMKTSPWGDQVVADNIHPTAWGSMLLGYGWAKGIAAHLTQAQEQDLASGSVAAIPLGAPYFTGGVGVTSTPQYSVVGSTFHLSWYLSRDGVSLADDTLVGTLPKRLRPPVDVFAPLVNVGAAPTLTPIAATPAGFWKISADGKIRVYGVAGSPTFMGISASWKI
jgi:lysophospholipase L1-like esterase